MAVSLIALALLGSPVSAWSAELFFHARTVADIDEIITPTFERLPRRQVVQSLDAVLANLVRTPERELLRLSFSGRLWTDFAREVDRSSGDPRDAEPVILNLQRLELELRPVEAASLRAGRMFLFGPLVPVDIDGGWLDVRAPVGLTAAFGGGREVRRDLSGVDSGAWDPPGARSDYFGNARESTWLVQAELGWLYGPVSLRAGHRTRWRQGSPVSQSTAVVGELDTSLVQLTALLDWNTLMGSADRVDAWLRVPFAGGRSGVWLGWRHDRPAFDGDSLFNVFAVTPSVGWRVGGRVATSERFSASLEGRLRAYAEGGRTPWHGGLGSSEQRSGGGALRGDWTPREDLRLRASMSADGGRGGTLVSEELAGLWEPVVDFAEIGLRLRHVWRSDDLRESQFGHLLAARLKGRYNLTSFGHLSTWVDWVSDYRFGRSIRVMVVAEFDLGPI